MVSDDMTVSLILLFFSVYVDFPLPGGPMSMYIVLLFMFFLVTAYVSRKTISVNLTKKRGFIIIVSSEMTTLYFTVFFF